MLEGRIFLAADISVLARGAGSIISGQTTPVALSARLSSDFSYFTNLQIRNDGDTPLTVNQINITGDGFSRPSGDVLLPVTINPGDSQFVQVAFTAASGGVKSGNVSIQSDDPDEGTFTFPIQVTAVGPNPDHDLGSLGSSLVSDTASYQFRQAQSFLIQPGQRLLRFDIDAQRANVQLAVSGKADDGDPFNSIPNTKFELFRDANGDGDFTSIDAAPSGTPIAPLFSRTLTHTDPGITYTDSGNIDLNKGTYFLRITQGPAAGGTADVTVNGTASVSLSATPIAAPHLDFRGNGQLILPNDFSPTAADFTDYGNISGTSGTRTFVLQNTGDAPLLISRVETGFHRFFSDSQTVTGFPTSIPAHGTASISVPFNKQGGSGITDDQVQDLTIYSDDPDNDVYVIGLKAHFITVPPATPAPSVQILNPQYDVVFDLGARPVDEAAKVQTIKVKNVSTVPVTLSPGSAESGFVIVTPFPSTPLAPGATAQLQIKTDDTVGAKTGDLTFTATPSGKAAESFTVHLKGEVTAGLVTLSGRSLPFGISEFSSSVDLGTTTIGGASAVQTLRVRNNSTSSLYLGNVTSTAGYTITRQLPWMVAPGGVAEFDVRMDGRATDNPGTLSFTARRTTGDTTPQTITFDVVGHAVAPGPLLVRGHNFYPIASGDTISSTADDTDFGTVARGAAVTRTFELRNTGTEAINFNLDNFNFSVGPSFGPELVDGFSVVSLPVARLLPGKSTTFSIRFNPGTSGDFNRTLQIPARRDTENFESIFYSVKFTGTVRGDVNVSIKADSANGSFAPPFPFGTISYLLPKGPSRLYSGVDPALESFTLTNTSNAPITLGKVSVGNGFAVEKQLTVTTLLPRQTASFSIRLKSDKAGTFLSDIVVPVNGVNVTGQISGSVVGDRATHAFTGDSSLDYRDDIDPIGFTPRKPGIDVSSFAVEQTYGATYPFTLRRANPQEGTGLSDPFAPVAFNIYLDSNGNGILDDGASSLQTLQIPRDSSKKRIGLPLNLKKGKYIITVSANGSVSSDRNDVLIPARVDAPAPIVLGAAKAEVRDLAGVLVPEASSGKVYDMKGARTITLRIKNTGLGFLDFLSAPTVSGTGGWSVKFPRYSRYQDASAYAGNFTDVQVTLPSTVAHGTYQSTLTLVTNARTVQIKLKTTV